MRICWNDSDPAPELIGHYNEIAIFFEGRRLFSQRTQELVWTNTRRFADVIGPGHDAINRAGWRNTSMAPFCFTGGTNHHLVAAAWATQIRTDDGTPGCNLAYAVLEQAEGIGLAKLLTALAFEALYQETRAISFVNIQARTSNHKSAALARSFGMRKVPQATFQAVKAGSSTAMEYYTYRLSAGHFAETAAQVTRERLQAVSDNRLCSDYQKMTDR